MSKGVVREMVLEQGREALVAPLSCFRVKLFK